MVDNMKLLGLLGLMSLTACDGDESTTTTTTTTTTTYTTTATTTTTETSETGKTTEGLCSDGLAPMEWNPDMGIADYDHVAGDFTLPTLDGDFVFADEFTGCDSYIFVNYSPGYTYPEQLLNSNVEDWLVLSPRNVHYFFVSYQNGADAQTDAEYMESIISTGMSVLDDDLKAYWQDRVHFVTESGWSLDGGLGVIQSAYGQWNMAIDRFQTYREGGYLSDPLYSWEDTTLNFLNYEAEFYNFEAVRHVELAAADATIVRIFDAEPIDDWGWAGVRGYSTVTLPDTAEMGAFDTMELDLTLDCGHPNYSECPEWDYLVYAYLCEQDDTTSCGTEIGRYITTYARPGRWVVDVTPFLALIKEGGEQHFAFYTTQGYDVTLDLRLSNQGKGYAPFALEYLWSGGYFNSDYNSAHKPVTVDIPAEATRVEIEATTSGHGYSSDPNNCGEFCNHQHEFTVNSNGVYMQEFPEAEGNNYYGCSEMSSVGVVPGQYGTWVYGRGGWCPGLQVDQWRQDVTKDVTAGSPATIEYRGLYDDAPRLVESTDANIVLTSYAVFYK